MLNSRSSATCDFTLRHISVLPFSSLYDKGKIKTQLHRSDPFYFLQERHAQATHSVENEISVTKDFGARQLPCRSRY